MILHLKKLIRQGGTLFQKKVHVPNGTSLSLKTEMAEFFVATRFESRRCSNLPQGFKTAVDAEKSATQRVKMKETPRSPYELEPKIHHDSTNITLNTVSFIFISVFRLSYFPNGPTICSPTSGGTRYIQFLREQCVERASLLAKGVFRTHRQIP